MENKNNIETSEKIPADQYVEATKGPVLHGYDYLPDHIEKYRCPSCGIISAADVLWKIVNSSNEPFCGMCKKPVVLILTK